MPRKDYTVHLPGKPWCEHSKVHGCGKCRSLALENARTNGVVTRSKVGAIGHRPTFGEPIRWDLQCRATLENGTRRVERKTYRDANGTLRAKPTYLVLPDGIAEGAEVSRPFDGWKPAGTPEDELPESWHVVERDLQGQPEEDLSASLLAVFWATGWDSLTLQERMLLWAREEGKESLLKSEYRK